MANDVKTAKKEKKPNLFARIGRYFKDVVGELKKLTWPTGKDLAKYTATVLAFIVLFAVCSVRALRFLVAWQAKAAMLPPLRTRCWA